MANEGSSPIERGVSFVLRLLVSLILPLWGAVMIALGVKWGMGWWIVAGVSVLAIAWYSSPEVRSYRLFSAVAARPDRSRPRLAGLAAC